MLDFKDYLTSSEFELDSTNESLVSKLGVLAHPKQYEMALQILRDVVLRKDTNKTNIIHYAQSVARTFMDIDYRELFDLYNKKYGEAA
jgi:hypothetical protein